MVQVSLSMFHMHHISEDKLVNVLEIKGILLRAY